MATLTVRQALVGLVAGVAGTLAMRYFKELPWSLAGIVGFAVAILAVSSMRTGERLRGVWDREPRWRSRR